MIIRALKKEDAQKAMELKILCWTEVLAGQAENTLELSEQVDFWTNWMNTADEYNDIRLFLGAFEETQLLGVAAGSFMESKDAPENGIELNGLWVFPQYRGRGVSLKLILYIIEYYIPLGVRRMEVYNPHFAPSNMYYRKLGGKVINQEYQMDGKLLVDIFSFDTANLRERLLEKLV